MALDTMPERATPMFGTMLPSLPWTGKALQMATSAERSPWASDLVIRAENPARQGDPQVGVASASTAREAMSSEGVQRGVAPKFGVAWPREYASTRRTKERQAGSGARA